MARMNVVGCAAGTIILTVEIPGNCAEVSVQVRPKRRREHGFAALRGEDDVDEKKAVRLRHVADLVEEHFFYVLPVVYAAVGGDVYVGGGRVEDAFS
jgi:hypothetical protein